MKQLYLFAFTFLPLLAFSQSTIKGTVKNAKGEPLPLVNIYLENTFDVVASDAAGNFSFVTEEKGEQVLVASMTGMPPMSQSLVLNDSVYTVAFEFEVTEELDEFIITAGSIASNDRAVAVLDPIEIVTTAGANGDIVGALQTLPGVQRNGGDQTGLMVRGGDVNESVMIIDGMVAQNAFNSTVPGVAQRSRFNPFQFKGTSFSTGGYTARYGQALSSVVDLETYDLPTQNNINVGANFAGVYIAGEKLMENNAVEFSGYYNNLAPFFLLAKSSVDFYDVPQGGGFSTRFVSQTEGNGIFKMNASHTFSNTGINIPDPSTPGQKINFGIGNQNTYLNSTFKNSINQKWKYGTGVSFSNNTDNISWGDFAVYRNDTRVQGRAEMIYKPTNRFSLLMGTELQNFGYTQQFDTLIGKFEEFISAGYVEAEWRPAKNFAVKPGVRGEYSKLLAQGNVSPRLAFALKTGKSGQIAAATGIFYQEASSNYLIFGYRPDFQQSIHYMLNYQVAKNNRTFRVEGYYKSYDHLVRENNVPYNPNAFRFIYGNVDNSGFGYAQGIDFFWRDKQSIKNFDYWISYSVIDTKRLYQNYTSQVTPDYVSQHNLNVIAKYFVEKLQTNFSASYNYASGRPYYDPNNARFLSDKAPDYHNVALTISYLTTIKKMFTVIYLSVDNVTNQKNILGYRYSIDGQERYPVQPAIYRSFFVGFNLSLTEFNKDEL